MKADLEMNGQGIQSLEIGMGIIKKIDEAGGPLSITEISDICGISKSKLHRYLTSFWRTGFLQRDASLRYSIGTNLIMMGIKAANRLDIKDQAKQTLLNLRDSLNESIFLSIWGGDGAPYPIDILESNRSINIGIKIGYPTSIVLTTSGRLFAAFLPHGETDPFIQKEFIQYDMDPALFREEISKVRVNGYSVTNETLVPGIVAVGCPIFDRNHMIIATISIVGISGILDLTSNSKAIAFLKTECSQLSHSLGYKSK